MKIKKLIDGNIKDYEEIALQEGIIFNRLSWLKIFDSNVHIYGIYDTSDNLIGGFHLYKQNKFGLTIYRNPPFTPTIGPFVRIKAENTAVIMDRWKEVLSSIANFFENLSYSIISVSLSKDIVDTQPFIWKKYKVIPSYTYVIDLNKSTEEIKKSMHARSRNSIQKALNDGLIAHHNTDFNLIKSLVVKTFLRQDKKVNHYFLDKILFEFAKENNSYSFVTFIRDEPIAVAFCVYDKTTSYYLLGGYDSDNKHYGAGTLALWKAINFSKELGLRYFDFEGSMVPQIERYFRSFGGRMVPCYRINKAKIPLEILLKFHKRELF